MRKVYINLVFIAFLLIVASCAPKQETVTTWHKIINIDVKLPTDSALVNNGMPSGFFLITPQSGYIRSHTYYYDIYYSLLDEVFKNSIPITYNEKVEYYIEFFKTTYRKNFIKWLERSETYMPHLKYLLIQEGLPTDLAYLPLIESGYNPKAVSRAHAVGMWQFIRSTGKIYGLKIDSYRDERRNVEKATLAAANYLRDLNDEFDSWELALASYNCGEVRVRNSIKLTNSTDYWEVSKVLPRETRNYVPKYMAALIISKNLKKYGFQDVNYDDKPKFAKVPVPPEKSLKDIAKVVGYNPEQLMDHNPSLVSGITPPGDEYEIYISPEYLEEFESNREELAKLKNVKPKSTIYKTYRVRNGDNLWLIARRFGVSVNSIKRTNNLRSNMIKPGQKLKIRQTRTFGSSSGVSTTYTSNKKSSTRSSGSRNVYIVKKGDTIGQIAENFGIGLSVLKRHNGLRSSNIREGQKLRIPAGSREPINYKIKNGDTLSVIADRYRVSVKDIQKWNNLRTTRLTAGNKLKIYR